MTRFFLLPLVLSFTVLSHAQTTSNSTSFTARNESSYAPVVLPHPSSASTPTTSISPNKAIFHSVVPPVLLHSLAMKDDGNQHVHVEGRARVVLLELIVNASGEPTELRILPPMDDALDVEVLATVGKFRYQPGLLNGAPFPMPVHMRYVVPVGAIY